MSNYGKFSNSVDEMVYSIEYDAIVVNDPWGESWAFVWDNTSLAHCVGSAALSQEDVAFLAKYKACIVHERSDGIVDVSYYIERLEAEEEMQALHSVYDGEDRFDNIDEAGERAI